MDGYIRVIDFAEQRGVKLGTVNQWLNRHKEFNKFIKYLNKEKYIKLDSKAFEELDAKYPPTQQVIIETETKRENVLLMELQKQNQKYIELLEETRRLEKANSDLVLEQQKQQLLLEDNEKQKQADQEKIEQLEHSQQLQDDMIAALKKKVEAMQNRSLWDRIRNKKIEFKDNGE